MDFALRKTSNSSKLGKGFSQSLGSSTAEALLNTVWFNNTIHFGQRGCKEHREMCWEDVKLCQTSTGQELFEFNERETKTPSGNDPRNVRAIAPKIIAVPKTMRNA